MNKGTNAILILGPGEYFQGAVSGAVASLKLQISEHAQVYLVQLLGHYINSENFYPTDLEGKPTDTLAHQLAAALEEENAEQKAKRMRQLGDFSLYVSGFFTNSLSRKLVDVDYYIGMGGAAYGTAAQLEEKKARAQIYLELSRKFPQFVDILSQISEEAGFNPGDAKDLLRVYDLWQKTGSERLAKKLAKAGIVPSLSGNGRTGTEDS